MTDTEAAERALTIARMAAQDMAEAGLSPRWIAIGLAYEARRAVDLAMPTEETAKLFRESLMA